MRNHTYYDREDDLKHCKVCGGGEGSLPTECPGYRMTGDDEESVYKGDMDFRNGAWAIKVGNDWKPL